MPKKAAVTAKAVDPLKTPIPEPAAYQVPFVGPLLDPYPKSFPRAAKGIFGALFDSGQFLAKQRLFESRMEKVPHACSAMGIDPELPDAKDRLLAALCAEKWPKGFTYAGVRRKPGKKASDQTREKQRADYEAVKDELLHQVREDHETPPSIDGAAEVVAARTGISKETVRGNFYKFASEFERWRITSGFLPAFAFWQHNSLKPLDGLADDGFGVLPRARGISEISVIARKAPKESILASAVRMRLDQIVAETDGGAYENMPDLQRQYVEAVAKRTNTKYCTLAVIYRARNEVIRRRAALVAEALAACGLKPLLECDANGVLEKWASICIISLQRTVPQSLETDDYPSSTPPVPTKRTLMPFSGPLMHREADGTLTPLVLPKLPSATEA